MPSITTWKLGKNNLSTMTRKCKMTTKWLFCNHCRHKWLLYSHCGVNDYIVKSYLPSFSCGELSFDNPKNSMQSYKELQIINPKVQWPNNAGILWLFVKNCFQKLAFTVCELIYKTFCQGYLTLILFYFILLKKYL